MGYNLLCEFLIEPILINYIIINNEYYLIAKSKIKTFPST